MSELNRERIIRGLECCKGSYDCFTCDIYKRGCAGFREGLARDALSLINELTEENAEVKANWQKLKDDYDNNDKEWREAYADSQSKWEKAYEKLELTLEGVMHFVDKWLDGKELEQDEVNRAITMREKTLQIVEKLTEENEAISERYAIQVVTAIELDKQVQRLNEENERLENALVECCYSGKPSRKRDDGRRK